MEQVLPELMIESFFLIYKMSTFFCVFIYTDESAQYEDRFLFSGVQRDVV